MEKLVDVFFIATGIAIRAEEVDTLLRMARILNPEQFEPPPGVVQPVTERREAGAERRMNDIIPPFPDRRCCRRRWYGNSSGGQV